MFTRRSALSLLRSSFSGSFVNAASTCTSKYYITGNKYMQNEKHQAKITTKNKKSEFQITKINNSCPRSWSLNFATSNGDGQQHAPSRLKCFYRGSNESMKCLQTHISVLSVFAGIKVLQLRIAAKNVFISTLRFSQSQAKRCEGR